MNFKEYMCEREKVINEFLNQPIDVIVEMIDFEDVKVDEIGSTNNATRYYFGVDEERYLVVFSGPYKNNSYELSYSLDKKGEEFTSISDLYNASKIYAGLLKSVKMFIEKNEPDKITMSITIPKENNDSQKKKSSHFQKMIKYVFKKYQEVFKEYKIGNVKRKSMGDFALDTLTIERRSNK